MIAAMPSLAVPSSILPSLDPRRIRPELEALLDQAPPHLLECYGDLIPAPAARTYRVSLIECALARQSISAAWLADPGEIAAFSAWSRLDWDSEQFGFPAARLDHLLAKGDYRSAKPRKQVLLGAVLDDCRCHRIRHLTARADSSDLAAIHALESEGFELIDGIQTFSLRLNRCSLPPPTVEVTRVRSEDIDQAVAIARHSYRFDRFHADTALPPAVADHLHATWVRNTCAKAIRGRRRARPAEEVFVARDRKIVTGYVTTSIDRDAAETLGVLFGTIVLVATSPHHRNQGVARAVTSAALDWFKQCGVAVVHVGTQFRNVAAGRLYESSGFRLIASSLTFRRLL